VGCSSAPSCHGTSLYKFFSLLFLTTTRYNEDGSLICVLRNNTVMVAPAVEGSNSTPEWQTKAISVSILDPICFFGESRRHRDEHCLVFFFEKFFLPEI
jgi:hypothetical protein